MNRDRPFYSKNKIINLINGGNYFIHPNALADAERDFGWGENEILKAIKKLQPTKPPFHKKTINWNNPEIWVDYYKARGLMGENVYTHFHIEDHSCPVKEIDTA